MNGSLRILIIVLVITIGSFAQGSETFDVSSFQPPKGWAKQVGPDAIQFSIEDKSGGNFCLISLFKSLPSLGSPKENFDAAWSTIVKETVPVSGAPQMMPADNKGEWLLAGGFAPFEKDGVKGVALLYTASGHGKMVNALVLTNTQAYEAAVAAFLESISFKKPTEENRQPTMATGGSQPSLAGNYWKQAGIRGGMLGHSSLSTGTFLKPISSSATALTSFTGKICSLLHRNTIWRMKKGHTQSTEISSPSLRESRASASTGSTKEILPPSRDLSLYHPHSTASSSGSMTTIGHCCFRRWTETKQKGTGRSASGETAKPNGRTNTFWSMQTVG